MVRLDLLKTRTLRRILEKHLNDDIVVQEIAMELEDIEIQLMGLQEAIKHTPNQDGTSSITLQQN
jgi:hypothetical protein